MLVLEHTNAGKQLNPATLNAVTGAYQINASKPIHALLAAPTATPDFLSQLQALPAIGKIFISADASFAHPLAETVAPLIQQVAAKQNYKHIVAAHTAFGKNIMPRAAGEADKGYISDIIAVEKEENTYSRPIYAGTIPFFHDPKKEKKKLLTIFNFFFLVIDLVIQAMPLLK